MGKVPIEQMSIPAGIVLIEQSYLSISIFIPTVNVPKEQF